MRNDSVNPEWHCIEIDETSSFNINREDAPFIKKIMGIYFFDKNEYTYVCEMLPSYFLRALGYSVHLKDGTPEDVAERLHSTYADCDSEDHYRHVSDINRLPSVPYGDSDDPVTEDDAREYWQGNPPF